MRVFFQMSRCVLISTLCTEHQNVKPKERCPIIRVRSPLVSSLEEWADADEYTRTPAPPLLKHMVFLSYIFITEMANERILTEPETQWQSIDQCSRTMTTEFRSTWRQTGLWLEQYVVTDKLLPYDQILHNAQSTHVHSSLTSYCTNIANNKV